jgi:hypothetical protein
MEHTGTTYLSKVLASNPDIMCGFECGFLLDDISRFPDVDPWYEWMQTTTAKGHWGVNKENMTRICAAKDYYEAYHLLKKYAGEKGSTMIRECFLKAKYIIDKTPRYAYCLDLIIEKIDVPFIVMQKNIYDLYTSYKKRGCELEMFLYRYFMCANSIKKACQKHPDRILVVDYDDLLQNTDFVLEKIHQLLKIPFYYQSSVETFFQKTGLNENTFVNEYGGMPINLDAEVKNTELSQKEISILRNLDRSIAKPELLRSWITGLFLRRRPGRIRRNLFRLYRYMV